MGVDLSGLEGFGDMSFGSLIEGEPKQEIVKESDGKPLMLKCADIEEDPNQPREKFDLTEMRASIVANIAAGRAPIKAPISVKPHPDKPGKWLLNDGARRFRSAVAEQLEEIPAFIDHEHDDYDQMVVNIQREGHTPIEIAKFIAKREALGDKKGEIAKRLGKPASYVSRHAALNEMPDCVQQAYDNGRCQEVEALYLLTKNFETYPSEISDLCVNGPETISKITVTELLARLKQAVTPFPPQESQTGNESTDVINGGFSNPNTEAGVEAEKPGTEPVPPTADDSGLQTNQGNEEGQNNPGMKEEKQPDPDKIRKPIVQIEHDGRPARLVLARRAENGLAWIKYDDDGQEIEIDIGLAKLVAVIEGA